ncbi:MAG: hypothetical protein IJ347_00090 [Faecalibacterium sp.]|nr:hypothetical protein [Faecalibacterium sp.]
MAESKKEKAESLLHQDHRERMRRRVERYGLESLEEHEALEYLLYFAIPRRDTNPIAHALLNRFGSFAAVLEAAEEELLTVEGVGPSTARFLHAIQAIDRYYVASRSRCAAGLKPPPIWVISAFRCSAASTGNVW